MTSDSTDTLDGTKLRLLESAGEVFAERGYRESTIRTICARAEANVSAVKYHFTDKRGLYRATLTFAIAYSQEGNLYAETDDEALPAAERLHGLIRLLLRRMLDPRRPAWHTQLLVRELMQPSAEAEIVAREFKTNWVDRFTRILGGLLGPDVSEDALRDGAYSIIGQCTFYRNARWYLESYEDRRVRTMADVDAVAARVYRFSSAALGIAEADPNSSGVSRKAT